MTRWQLPAYSPLEFRALLAGARAVLQTSSRVEHEAASRIQTHLDAKRVLMVDSGTSALTLAIRAVCGQQRERLVALPAYSCFDVATAAMGADAQAVLYDLDPNTLQQEFGSLERAMQAGPSCVVVAHLYGVPVDVAGVRSLSDSHGAVVIEDAAQAVGA